MFYKKKKKKKAFIIVSFGFNFSAFFFFTIRAILHTPYGAALRHTHSLLPYNCTFSSSSSFFTLHRLIYLCTFSTTFIRHPLFIFLLEISIDNRQIPKSKIQKLFPKSTTIDPFLFLVSAPYLPIISSSLMFPSPTCPLRSAPRTILSRFDTLSINHPGLLKNHFSPPCCC